MPRTCPDCNVPLQQQDFNGITLDTCTKCAGIFFDEGEVQDVRKMGPGAFDELDAKVQPEEIADAFAADRLRKCPQCGTGMEPYRYLYSSPILLDSCDRCGGIWVQNGELQAMSEYLRGNQGAGSKQSVVAQMKVATDTHIDRANRVQRAFRSLMVKVRP